MSFAQTVVQSEVESARIPKYFSRNNNENSLSKMEKFISFSI